MSKQFQVVEKVLSQSGELLSERVTMRGVEVRFDLNYRATFVAVVLVSGRREHREALFGAAKALASQVKGRWSPGLSAWEFPAGAKEQVFAMVRALDYEVVGPAWADDYRFSVGPVQP